MMDLSEFFLQKRREKLVLAVCIFISLVFLVLPRSPKLYFARKTLNAIFYPSARLAKFARDYGKVREENRRLKRMVASLMLEREKLKQYRDERERLRRLAAFKEDQFYKLLPCEVIGRNPDNFRSVLIIDKGREDSVRTRMPVLSYQGYAGRVLKVFPNSSWVELICSPNSYVSCMDKRSRVVGILEWKRGSEFALKNVGKDEDIGKGDTLITSGFGGVVPKGFPVARVTKASKVPNIIGLIVDAESLVNFNSLEEVFVILNKMPWEKGIVYDIKDEEILREITKEAK